MTAGHDTTFSAAGMVQGLRAIADLLDQLALPGLSVTVNEQHVIIQITPRSGDVPARFRACAAFAAAIGTTVGHQADTAGPTCGWMTVDGCWAGHRVHVFTPVDTDDGQVIAS